MIKCLISIVVIIYNIENYLNDCLNSIICQGGNDIEIILVNDASTDTSGRICNEYKEKDERIHIINNTHNMGASASRNVGLKSAKGKWISFVDGDDMLTETAISVMRESSDSIAELVLFDFNYYKKNQIVVNYKNTMEIQKIDKVRDLNEYKLSIIRDDHFNKGLLEGKPLQSPWGKMYKVEFLKENSLCFNQKLKKAQDIVFSFESAHYLTNIELVRESVYLYRYNDEAISWRFSEDIIDKQTLYIEELYKIIESFKETEASEFITAMQYRCLYEMGICLKLGAYHKDCNWNRKERKQWFEELCDCKWITDITPDYIRDEDKSESSLDVLWAIKNRNIKKLDYYFWMNNLERKLKKIRGNSNE